jgi:hypothetical protein
LGKKGDIRIQIFSGEKWKDYYNYFITLINNKIINYKTDCDDVAKIFKIDNSGQNLNIIYIFNLYEFLYKMRDVFERLQK